MSLLLMFTSGQHTHTHKKKHNKRKQVGKKGGDAQGAASWVLHNWSWRTEHKRCGSAVAGLVGLRQRTKKERKQQSKQGQVGAAPTTKFLFLFPFVSFFFLSFVFFFLFFSLFAEIDSDTQKHLVTKQRKKGRKKERRKQGRKMCTLTVDSQFTLARLTIHFTSHHSSPCRLHGKHKALRGLVFQKREREREREKKKKRNQVEQ